MASQQNDTAKNAWSFHTSTDHLYASAGNTAGMGIFTTPTARPTAAALDTGHPWTESASPDTANTHQDLFFVGAFILHSNEYNGSNANPDNGAPGYLWEIQLPSVYTDGGDPLRTVRIAQLSIHSDGPDDRYFLFEAEGVLADGNQASSTPYTGYVGVDPYGLADRWEIRFADEGGGQLLEDKWYQIGIHIKSDAVITVVNGTVASAEAGAGHWRSDVTTTGGGLNLDVQSGWGGWYPRWTGASTFGTANTNVPVGNTQGFHGKRGPAAWHWGATADIPDLTDTTVRDRIWGMDGHFKYAGENGSLWFYDDYTTTGTWPYIYYPNGFFCGSLIHDRGTASLGTRTGGNDGYRPATIAYTGMQTGFKKAWERKYAPDGTPVY